MTSKPTSTDYGATPRVRRIAPYLGLLLVFTFTAIGEDQNNKRCDLQVGQFYKKAIVTSSKSKEKMSNGRMFFSVYKNVYGWCPVANDTSTSTLHLELPSLFIIKYSTMLKADMGKYIGVVAKPKKFRVYYQRSRNKSRTWHQLRSINLVKQEHQMIEMSEFLPFVLRRLKVVLVHHPDEKDKKTCLAMNIIGCKFDENIVSYAMKESTQYKDLTYDNRVAARLPLLSGGLGWLTDGDKNVESFVEFPASEPAEIVFKFDSKRKCSNVIVYSIINELSNYDSPTKFFIETSDTEMFIGDHSKPKQTLTSYSFTKVNGLQYNTYNISLPFLVGRYLRLFIEHPISYKLALLEVSILSELFIEDHKELLRPTVPVGATLPLYIPSKSSKSGNVLIDHSTTIKTLIIVDSQPSFNPLIVGIIIAVFIIVLLLICFVVFYCRRRSRSRTCKHRHCLPDSEFSSPDDSSAGSAVSSARKFHHNSAPMSNRGARVPPPPAAPSHAHVVYQGAPQYDSSVLYLANQSHSSADSQTCYAGQKMALPSDPNNAPVDPNNAPADLYSHSLRAYDARATMQTRKLPDLPKHDDYDTIPDLSTLPLMTNHVASMPKNNSTPVLPLNVANDFARRYICNAESNSEKIVGPVNLDAFSSMHQTRPLAAVGSDTTAFVAADQIVTRNRWALDLHLCLVMEPELAGTYVVKRGVANASANQIKCHNEALSLLRCLDHKNILCLAFDTEVPGIQYTPSFGLEWAGENLVEFISSIPTNIKAASSSSLIYIGASIAEGMDYLEQNGVIHRDLAARNCSIDRRSLQVKIGDFARTCERFHNDYCDIYGDGTLVPARWIAWESWINAEYTHKSDVWSFAVTLWEIFSFQRPFSEFNDNFDVIDHMSATNHSDIDQRLSQPEYIPKEVYDLMVQCWSFNRQSRPNFYEISLFLGRKTAGANPESFANVVA